MTPRVDQALAGMHAGDAISHDALAIRAALRRAGFASEIFCDPAHLGPEVRAQAWDFRAWSGGPEDLVIYHHAIASPLVDWFLRLPARRLLRYHNITPAHHLRGVNDTLADQLAQGRAALPRLARVSELAICDSSFNAAELDQLGCPRTAVVPIVIDFGSLGEKPDTATLAALRQDPRRKILFVGRIVPNKRQDDLLRLHALRRALGHAPALLLLVGSWGSTQRYHAHLTMLAEALGLRDSVRFAGHVSNPALLAHYQAADLFVCLSEHEGFCVPLVEAMHHRVPIVALAAGAVPETLGGGGLLVRDRHLPAIAEIVDVALRDETLRAQIRERQAERLRAFEPARVEGQFLALVEEVVRGGPARTAPASADSARTAPVS